MVYDDDGHLIPFDFESVLIKIPVLNKLGLDLTVYSFAEPVDSSNIDIPSWQQIGGVIAEQYDRFDGFVVLHGTDTMAYSASALSFMLEGLAKPVIFTGAQIPIGATRSDARENLIAALEIASKRKNGQSMVQEVCIYFNYKLLRGNRSQKLKSSEFGAFGSENYPNLAEAGIEIKFHETFLHQSSSADRLQFHPGMDAHVGLLKLYPGMTDSWLEAALQNQDLKGLVIESFGSGNVNTKGKLVGLLESAIGRGMIICNVSQCTGGIVLQGRYETSRMLNEIGVISGHDITTEAAVTKMMYLLGNQPSMDEARRLLSEPIRGEMSVKS